MIPFNAPPVVGTELDYMQSAMGSGKLCGDGGFTRRCQQWLEQRFGSAKVLLTPSCTASLEMAALLLDIQPGDEVIMPSYTFVSTANAFVLRGAKIVFVDVRPDTMNIDETLIEAAITDKTRVIVPVHYAGVACEMDTIMALAKKHNLFVVEDAAQGVMSTYKGRALGTIGHIGCFSFHETKNYTAGGEGGATLINDKALIERAEIIREKMLNLLDKEVPHGTAVEIEQFEEREDKGILDISAVIYCEKKSHKGIVIGAKGAMLKKIGALARADMEEMFGCKVFLQLWVKVKEDWRNSAGLIRNFGYDGRDLQ